jgi:hypothetical protein
MPVSLLEAIMHGINSWIEQGDDASTTLRAPFYGSLHPDDITITQAFSEQSRTLGWSYGHTMAEAAAREMAAIDTEIRSAYGEYKQDHFIIPRHLSSLFTSRSLEQRLLLDIDSKQCWLNSYTEAVARQQTVTHRYIESAKNFFQPRRTYQPNATPEKTSSGSNVTTLPHPSSEDTLTGTSSLSSFTSVQLDDSSVSASSCSSVVSYSVSVP